MSIFYYLVCETHKESILITDNKGNDWFNRGLYLEFQLRHVDNPECKLNFINEYEHDCMPQFEFENGKLHLRGLITDKNGTYQKFIQELEPRFDLNDYTEEEKWYSEREWDGQKFVKK